jgi:L-malate glycosyltransferase
MKVVHVDTGREWRGGQTQLLNLVRARPQDRLVIHPEALLRPTLVAEGIPHDTVRFRGPVVGAMRLRSLLVRLQPDVVAAHTSHAHSQCLLAGVADRLVVHRRLDFRARPSVTRRWKYAAPQAYVSVSKAVSRVLKDLGVPGDGIWLAHDGVDSRLVDAAKRVDSVLREDLGWPADARVVLAVGALVEHKGHDCLLRAMVDLPGVFLAIAGEGELREQLAGRIEELGLTHRAQLLGYREDAYRLMKSCDVFCHPSLEEGMGQAVVEAMLCKVPVVATRAGGVPEVLGDCGGLVPINDVVALSACLNEALSNRSEEGLIVADRRARDAFSVSRMIHCTESAYRSVGSRRGRM